MFRKSCFRNSFLIKSCQELPVGIIQGSLNKTFFNHIENTSNEQKIAAIADLKGFEKKNQVRFGNAGVQNLVSELVRAVTLTEKYPEQ